jgi:hypothetical protein
MICMRYVRLSGGAQASAAATPIWLELGSSHLCQYREPPERYVCMEHMVEAVTAQPAIEALNGTDSPATDARVDTRRACRA